MNLTEPINGPRPCCEHGRGTRYSKTHEHDLRLMPEPDTDARRLECRIVNMTETGIEYAVWDGESIASSGISSDPMWLIHDAGGYHTAERFNEAYPEGWWVEFPQIDFDPPKAKSTQDSASYD